MKYHKLCSIFLFLFMHVQFVPAFSQTYPWAKGEGGPGNDAANAVTTDDWGNVYMTGNIAGYASFEGIIYQGRGIYDVFIAKYDSSGNLLWVKTFGGDDNEQGNSIRYVKNYIYVAGHFNDTSWFGNNMLLSKGEADVFVAKLDLNGNLVWVKQAGGSGYDWATSVDADNAGNVYITGSYETSIRFDTTLLTTANFYSESFVAKYNLNGNLLWAKSSVGNNTNLLTGIACDYHNSIFVTGYFGADFTLDNTTVSSSSASYDIVLGKLADDGSLVWLRKAGSNYEDAAQSVCSDKAGNPSITGYFAGTAQFGSNSVTYYDYNDVFVARYDSLGNNLWVRAGRGQQLDVGFAITADEQGNLYTTGMFQDSINFDGYELNVNDREIFIISYDKNGNIRWVDKAGERDTDCGLGITVSQTGEVVLCGYYVNRCNFGNIILDYADGNDLFIARYNAPVVNSLVPLRSEEQVAVFPNPANDVINIKFGIAGTHLVSICDINGRVVFTSAFLTESCRISTDFLATGIYQLTVVNSDKLQHTKIIVGR